MAHRLGAAMALTLLGSVALAPVAAPAVAAPETITATAGGRIDSGIDAGIDAKGAQARLDGKLLGRPLVLPRRTKGGTGIDTAITCYVTGLGPSLLGNYISFSISVNCVGGTPQFLEAWQNIGRHIAPGNWVVEPGSSANCEAPVSTILLCGSIASCYRAGANYDGYAVLYGIDEFGVPHWSEFYAPPRWVGCVV